MGTDAGYKKALIDGFKSCYNEVREANTRSERGIYRSGFYRGLAVCTIALWVVIGLSVLLGTLL